MSHLTLESLARLVDEAADPKEDAHLAVCGECRRELEALREQREALAALPAMAPAPDGWPALRERLMDEGLIPGRRGAGRMTGLRRVAAAVAIFAGGASMGYLARGPLPPATGAAVAGAPAGGAVGAEAAPASGATRTAAGAGDPAGDSDALPTGSVGAPPDVGEAQELFLAALDRYMAENAVQPADPATRLAALDHIVHTTAEALNEAPADPVLNSYHLTAVAQRNAILRQIAQPRGEPVF